MNEKLDWRACPSFETLLESDPEIIAKNRRLQKDSKESLEYLRSIGIDTDDPKDVLF